MESIELKVNVDKEAMRATGVDPDTSEGKREIVELLLEALDHYGDQHGEELGERRFAMLEALLGS